MFSEAETAVREQEKKEMERRKRETGNDGKWPEGADLEVCELKFGPLNRRRERVIDEDDTYGELSSLFPKDIVVLANACSLSFVGCA